MTDGNKLDVTPEGIHRAMADAGTGSIAMVIDYMCAFDPSIEDEYTEERKRLSQLRTWGDDAQADRNRAKIDAFVAARKADREKINHKRP